MTKKEQDRLKKAIKLAFEIVLRTNATMRLEGQGVSEEVLEQNIIDKTLELYNKDCND